MVSKLKTACRTQERAYLPVVWLTKCPPIAVAVAGSVPCVASPPSLSLPRLLESFQKVPFSVGNHSFVRPTPKSGCTVTIVPVQAVFRSAMEPLLSFSAFVRLVLCIQTKYEPKIHANAKMYAAPRNTL